MAASIKKSKIAQNDLRKFMKEIKTGKIDSPLAKYNNFNQLTCIVCNSVIKSDSLWGAHIRGRSHKENIEKLKKPEAKTKPVDKIPKKRPPHEDEDGAPNFKKPKSEPGSVSLPADFFDDGHSSSSNPSSKEEKVATRTGEQNTSDLPPGFFDSETKPESSDGAKTDVAEPITNKIENLPEGFFDDPIADAKVRKVEYKDPMDEEWDKFQKIISTESTVSQAIMDEDIEESKAEREIDEIDEQMHNWSRVQMLQNMKEKIANASNQDQIEAADESSSADEQEYEEFLDWRSKRVR